jgi:acetyltransferase-like isoleucine patch superfamily enzyme
MHHELQRKLDELTANGVIILDPRQTYLDDAIDLVRVCGGATLYPGTRLLGAKTFIGPGAKIGTEGPATVENAVLGENAEIASGFVREAVLLRDAKLGANAHVRPGTLLEEEASTAHAVGLKHSILMSFVTMGSLINFCDALISGGTSRGDHTEVGSGFIHFNFTPRGQSGDKATPSLIGDVVHGAFLREPRIFLGGLSAMVGPQKVGFGSLTVAGQVIRKEVPARRMVGNMPLRIDKDINDLNATPERIIGLNLNYIGQLTALQAWYSEVRLARIPNRIDYKHVRLATEAGLSQVSACIDERVQRLRLFLEERGQVFPSFCGPQWPRCPLKVEGGLQYTDHIDWVAQLSPTEVEKGILWLNSIAENIVLANKRRI